MPRQPRLDAPDTLHHVMVRGLKRRAIFRDDTDRNAFVARLTALADAGALTVYAWALLPNHAHLLVRTGTRPRARSMRSLLTGYAGAFNRRHHRVGHLFQNRYKSIAVEAEPYRLELVRYFHLNPVRAQVVPDLRALDRYAGATSRRPARGSPTFGWRSGAIPPAPWRPSSAPSPLPSSRPPSGAPGRRLVGRRYWRMTARILRRQRSLLFRPLLF